MQTLINYLNTLTTPELKRIADAWQADLPDRLYQGNTYHLAQEMSSDYLLRRHVAKMTPDQLIIVAIFSQKPDFTYTKDDLTKLIAPGKLDVPQTTTKLREIGLMFYERGKAEPSTAVAARFGMAALPKNVVPANQIINFVIPRELARPLRRIVIERLGNNETEAEAVLAGIVVSDKDDSPAVLVRQAIARAKTGVRPSGQPLQRLLNGLEIDLLEVKSEGWGIYNPGGSQDRNSLIATLVKALSDADEQQRYVSDHFTPECARLFDQLQALETGRITRAALLQQYNTEARLQRALRPLVDALLVWESFENGIELVFVPQEIAKPTHDETRRARIGLQTVTQPTNVSPAPTFALAWDSLTFLNYVFQNETELTSTNNTIPKRITKKVMEMLWTGPMASIKDVSGEISALSGEPQPKTKKRKTAVSAEADVTITVNGRPISRAEYLDTVTTQRFDFAVTLCGLLELYDLDDRKLVAGPNLDEFLALDFHEQTRRLMMGWLTNPFRTGTVSYPYYYARSDVIVKVNKTMFGWLEECETDVWYDLESLIGKVYQADPYYFRSRKELVQQYGAHLVDEILKSWKVQESYVIRQTFNSVFEWLGIVRIGRDDNLQPKAFSVTPYGRYLIAFMKAAPLTALLDAQTNYTALDDVFVLRPQKPTKSADNAKALDDALKTAKEVRPPLPDMGADKVLLVQPNFEVLYFAPAPQTLWTLLQFTDASRLDQVAIFSLNRLATLRGLAGGLSPQKVSSFLNERSQQPVPDNVAVNIADWARNFKRVTVSRATLLEVEEAGVLDELEKLAIVKDLMVRRLSPTSAIIELPGEADANDTPKVSASSYYGYGVPKPYDYEEKMKQLRNRLKGQGYFSK